MSIPFIIPGFGTRERAITDIIESTALQKTALAHIMNAEGEKIQAAILTQGLNSGNVLEVNDSALAMLYNITRLELILEAKLNVLADLSVLDTFLPDLPTLPLVPLQPTSTGSAVKSGGSDSNISAGNINEAGDLRNSQYTGNYGNNNKTGGLKSPDTAADSDCAGSIDSQKDISAADSAGRTGGIHNHNEAKKPVNQNDTMKWDPITKNQNQKNINNPIQKDRAKEKD